jgi:hypothetical protein
MGMRRLAIPFLALVLTACGNAAVEGSTPAPPPPSHPATTHGPSRPPRAYLVTADGRATMTIGTYCWSSPSSDGTSAGVCADAMPFENYPDLASIHADPGDQVRLLLGFTPTRPAEVAIDGHAVPLAGDTVVVTRHGVLTVFARAPEGDVSYGIRLTGDG